MSWLDVWTRYYDESSPRGARARAALLLLVQYDSATEHVHLPPRAKLAESVVNLILVQAEEVARDLVDSRLAGLVRVDDVALLSFIEKNRDRVRAVLGISGSEPERKAAEAGWPRSRGGAAVPVDVLLDGLAEITRRPHVAHGIALETLAEFDQRMAAAEAAARAYRCRQPEPGRPGGDA